MLVMCFGGISRDYENVERRCDVTVSIETQERGSVEGELSSKLRKETREEQGNRKNSRYSTKQILSPLSRPSIPSSRNLQ